MTLCIFVMRSNGNCMRNYIWTHLEYYNDAAQESYEAENGVFLTFEEWQEIVNQSLSDKRLHLNREVPGVIVAYLLLSRRHGRVPSSVVFSSNINSILHSEYDASWYGENGDIHGEMTYDDGAIYALYRIAPDMDTAKDLAHRIAYQGLSEDDFKKETFSLYPAVAKVYGWPGL